MNLITSYISHSPFVGAGLFVFGNVAVYELAGRATQINSSEPYLSGYLNRLIISGVVTALAMGIYTSLLHRVAQIPSSNLGTMIAIVTLCAYRMWGIERSIASESVEMLDKLENLESSDESEYEEIEKEAEAERKANFIVEQERAQRDALEQIDHLKTKNGIELPLIPFDFEFKKMSNGQTGIYIDCDNSLDLQKLYRKILNNEIVMDFCEFPEGADRNINALFLNKMVLKFRLDIWDKERALVEVVAFLVNQLGGTPYGRLDI